MADSPPHPTTHAPLHDMDEWEDFLKTRYPEGESGDSGSLDNAGLPAGVAGTNKKKTEFRNYETDARPTVREFYRQNHAHQTLDFVRAKKAEYTPRNQRRMGIWEAMEFLNTLVDESDPDVDFTQIEHLMQTAEAIRKDGHPRWFVLTGLIHDLGKILCLWGEPQWAVVGDTFPVGCAWDRSIVFHDFFESNPDRAVPEYQTKLGIYSEGCGLDSVHLSWGHDEYLYHVVKEHLPESALYMIRYHSFYPAHKEDAYGYLMNGHDREMFRWVHAFNPYDLYSKGLERPDVNTLRPYYEDLIAEFFPPVLNW
ncbi:MAG: inositol oxygenase [Armatimonadetes bacterium]|nr:inositol oxygenase [Armatimonadota bacterium]